MQQLMFQGDLDLDFDLDPARLRRPSRTTPGRPNPPTAGPALRALSPAVGHRGVRAPVSGRILLNPRTSARPVGLLLARSCVLPIFHFVSTLLAKRGRSVAGTTGCPAGSWPVPLDLVVSHPSQVQVRRFAVRVADNPVAGDVLPLRMGFPLPHPGVGLPTWGTGTGTVPGQLEDACPQPLGNRFRRVPHRARPIGSRRLAGSGLR